MTRVRKRLPPRLECALPWALLLGIVLIWLAPITLGGRMPVGGDVTSFFLPIMSYYHRALAAGRIPLWNELWGFGFPVLAESQTGVYYPPHLLLYGLFETEVAYAINIVLHSVLAAWFAYLCGRSFGLGRWGATLTGIVFAGNGFFIIHFPHQWSYTTACWMPLAVALAWQTIKVEGRGSRVESQKEVESPESRVQSQTDTPPPPPCQGGDKGGYQKNVEGPASQDQNSVKSPESRGQRREEDGPSLSHINPQDGMRRRVGAALGLAGVLAVQMLAGHFQIAFYTQVVVLLLGLVAALQVVSRARRRRSIGSRSTPPRSSLLWLCLAVAAAFVLAAVQILPSYELVRIALPEGRDFEYLSGFANTPLHLVSYLLPTLFHVNPLWRPVAWDPFHTSPEECFSYVGLLPLCLAVAAAWRWRREPRVRLWVFVTAVTLVLSMGPYVPGFRLLIMLPGFDAFRAPARWTVATALFLGLLAGRALDGMRATDRLRIWLRALMAAFVLVSALHAAGMLLLLHPVKGRGPTEALFNSTWSLAWPWPGETSGENLNHGMGAPQTDLRAITGLANLGYRVESRPGEPAEMGPFQVPLRRFTLRDERGHLLLQEFAPPALMMAALWVTLDLLERRRRVSKILLVSLAALDLGAATWLRPIDWMPMRSLVEQSPVLKRLQQEPGQRVLDQHQNLAMLSGAAPAQSYRTVDIPIPFRYLLNDVREPGIQRDWNERVLGQCDLAWVLIDEDPTGAAARPEDERILDSALGRIVFGPGLARGLPRFVPRFRLRRVQADRTARGWLARSDADAFEFEQLIAIATSPARARFPSSRYPLSMLLNKLSEAARLVQSEPESEVLEFEAHAPGALVLSELGYPGWTGKLTPRDGQPIDVRVSENGCRVVMIPRAGAYRLELAFRSRSYETGRLVSAFALAMWAIALIFSVWPARGRLALGTGRGARL